MIKIEVDSREITEALRNLSQAVTNMRPAFEAIGASMVSNIQSQLGQGETPWGDPFEPLKRPRRRQGIRAAGDVPLNDTRQHIYNRITHQADDDSVAIGMNENVPIGATHQFGSPSKNIPARPFLPIRNDAVDFPAAWEHEIIDTINNHIKKAL